MASTLTHKKFLYVCTGNICRSPTAEGLFEHSIKLHNLAHRLSHDSAGVDSHHIGHAPDARSQATAAKHGTALGHLRARNVRASDFSEFDVILAMDESHLNALHAMKPEHATAHIALHLEYCGIAERTDVPDPYYGAQADFDYVYDLLHRANEALIARLIS